MKINAKEEFESIVINTMTSIDKRTTLEDIDNIIAARIGNLYYLYKDKYLSVANIPLEDVNDFMNEGYLHLEIVQKNLDNLRMAKELFELYDSGYLEIYLKKEFPDYIHFVTYEQERIENTNEQKTGGEKIALGFQMPKS